MSDKTPMHDNRLAVPVKSPGPVRARGNLTSHMWQKKFLRALRKVPSVKHAAAAAGVHRATCYRARDLDPGFSSAWDACIAESVDTVEATCFRLAIAGDPRLIEFILKAHRGETYRERSEVAVGGGLVFLPVKQPGPQ